jgi:hypothetical protein
MAKMLTTTQREIARAELRRQLIERTGDGLLGET